MPKVVFQTPFFDGERRYRKDTEYDVPDNITLPTRGIRTIDGKKPGAKPATKPATKPVVIADSDIISAISKLVEGEETHWTNDGKPEVKAINELLEDGKIKAVDRDRIWAIINE